MIKLPRTGYLMPKYELTPKLVLTASKLFHKMMKLPRTGDPVSKYQIGSQASNVCIKIMP